MYYLDYAKKVGERYILNFFADTIEDLANVPTNEPYITRNGFNYGIPLDSSVVTIVENGAQKNYVLQNGAYVAGGDIPSVLGTLEATENKTYKASDEDLEGYSQVTVNVQPNLQTKSVTVNGTVEPDEGYDGLSEVTVNVPATPTETKTVEPDFSNGNQTLTPSAGKVFSSVTLTKPANLTADNIKKGVIICGIEGTYEAAGA